MSTVELEHLFFVFFVNLEPLGTIHLQVVQLAEGSLTSNSYTHLGSVEHNQIFYLGYEHHTNVRHPIGVVEWVAFETHVLEHAQLVEFVHACPLTKIESINHRKTKRPINKSVITSSMLFSLRPIDFSFGKCLLFPS